MKKRFFYIIITVIVFFLSLSVITIFKDILFIRGFSGDFLIVIFMYYLIKTFFIELNPIKTAFSVFAFASFIEFLQLFDIITRFNITNGVLLILLGKTFDLWDIVAYFMGALFVLLMDKLYLSKDK